MKKVTLTRSLIARKPHQKATAASLGLHRVGDSIIHEDVMVGAPDMTITGTTRTGENVKIFENGEWAF